MQFSCSWQRIALALAIAAPIAASAQPEAADPRDPSIPGPAIPYRSSFSDYDAYQDVALAPWRKSNDDVRAAAQMEGMAGTNAMSATPASGASADQKGKE